MNDERPFLQIPAPGSDPRGRRQQYEKWLEEQKEKEEKDNETVIIIEV